METREVSSVFTPGLHMGAVQAQLVPDNGWTTAAYYYC